MYITRYEMTQRLVTLHISIYQGIKNVTSERVNESLARSDQTGREKTGSGSFSLLAMKLAFQLSHLHYFLIVLSALFSGRRGGIWFSPSVGLCHSGLALFGQRKLTTTTLRTRHLRGRARHCVAGIPLKISEQCNSVSKPILGGSSVGGDIAISVIRQNSRVGIFDCVLMMFLRNMSAIVRNARLYLAEIIRAREKEQIKKNKKKDVKDPSIHSLSHSIHSLVFVSRSLIWKIRTRLFMR